MSDAWKALQEWRQVPTLQLHRQHLKDDAIRPLPCEIMLNVFAPLGSEPQAPDDPHPIIEDAKVSLDKRQLQITSTLHDEAAISVMLLFAEVRLGQDRQTGLPLIVIAGTEGGTIWLVLVEGNENAGRRAVSSLGEAGAIRSDFHKSFTLNPKPLGSGSNAAVYKVQARCPGGEGVHELVGKIGFASGETQDSIPNDVRQEVEMLSAIARHPSIVGFHGLFRHTERVEDAADDKPQTVTRWILTLQFCSQGDLFSLVAKAPLSEARGKEVVRGLLSALAHVHQLGIIHRDVKPENMLIAGDGRALLADFGISCHSADQQQMRRRCGSPSYAAPEILGGKSYGPKVDCFSSGSVLFFILSGKLPFDGPNIASMLRRTERCVVDFEVSSYFKMLTDSCKEFILTLLVRIPDKRPQAEEALKHTWIEGEAPNVPDRKRKSNTIAASSDTQHVAALALAGITVQDNEGMPASKGGYQSAVPATERGYHSATGAASSSSSNPRRSSEAAGDQRAQAVSPRPARKDRLGSLTGKASAPTVAAVRRFSNLPQALTDAKRQGDSFSAAFSDRSSLSDSDGEDSDTSRHSMQNVGSPRSPEPRRPGEEPRRPDEESNTLRSSLTRRFRRIMATPRGATPAAAPAPAAASGSGLVSPAPRPPPMRSQNRASTVDPNAVRPHMRERRERVASPPASSSNDRNPPQRAENRTRTTDSRASRFSRLGSLAQQLASRVGGHSQETGENTDLAREDAVSEESHSPESPERLPAPVPMPPKDSVSEESLSPESPERLPAPVPMPPKAPPPQKGGARKAPAMPGRRVSIA